MMKPKTRRNRRILALRVQGWTWRKIAKHFDRDVATIVEAAKREQAKASA